jgi:hypothetical protein
VTPAVLLVLAFMLPTGKVDSWSVQIPPNGVLTAWAHCKLIEKQWLAGEPLTDGGLRLDADAPRDPGHLNRSSICITVNPAGRDT